MDYETTAAEQAAEPQTKTAEKRKVEYGKSEPRKLAEINLDFVIDYCKAQGADGVKWLQGLYDTPKLDKKTKEPRELTFFDVRLEFARRYYPKLVSQGSYTMKDRIMAL